MTTYRCYFISPMSSISGASQIVDGVRDFDSTTDDEACIQAEVVCRRSGPAIEGFELWQRDRLVYRHRRAPNSHPSLSPSGPSRAADQVPAE
jgi:hypothetical protein